MNPTSSNTTAAHNRSAQPHSPAGPTRKLAFLRSVDVQRADPFLQRTVHALAAEGVHSKLFFTHGDCTEGDFPGESARLPADVTPGALAEAVADWGADAAVSISLPCENALRDATAKALLEARGIRTVMSPLTATWTLTDKWETKQALLRLGLDVPEGIRLDSDLLAGRGLPVPAYRDAVRVEARRIGFPLMAKPLWDSTSMGIRRVADPEALDGLLADPPEVSCVLEECVTGALCSVDITGTPGDYRVLPVCWTGQAGGEAAFTFADLRWAGPLPAEAADFAPVAQALTELLTELGVEGSVNVDMIHADGRYRVLEINPRIGGATTLCSAASDTNSFDTLTDIALGRHVALPAPARRWAIEFLTRRLTPEERRELTATVEVVTAHELVVDGVSHGDIITLTCEFGGEEACLKELAALGARGVVPAGTLAKLQELLGS